MKSTRLLIIIAAMFMIMPATLDAETVTLRIADQFPLTHFASKTGTQAFMKAVEKMSHGNIKFKHYPAGQLAKAAGMLDAVKNRVTDIASVGIVYVSDRMPLSGAVMLPGLFNECVAGTRAYDKLTKNELMEAEFLRHGVRPLYVSLAPVYQIQLTSRESITDISQLQGKKLRTAGAIMELTAKALGATPVTVGPSDFYLALQRGTVDGALYMTASWKALSLHEVLNSSTTNAGLGTVAFANLINEEVWKGLPPDVQQVLLKAGQATGEAAAAVFDKYVAGANKQLAEAGKNIYALSPKVLAQMQEKLTLVENTWLDQMRSRNLPGDKILAAFKQYLKEP
ncbi:TRAP transporter substrate-binding protein DctP [bacterium]|nr:TRAP transporter substrate-binding protein DctP [bacterium]